MSQPVKVFDVWTARLILELPNGEQWAVPTLVIAQDRAKFYANEYGGDVDKSLREDTIPLFEEDEYELTDWAANNMNWSDVKPFAEKVEASKPMTASDFQEAWVNGKKWVRR